MKREISLKKNRIGSGARPLTSAGPKPKTVARSAITGRFVSVKGRSNVTIQPSTTIVATKKKVGRKK